METFKDLPVLLFATQADWRAWLKASHTQPRGIWLKHAKKSSGKTSVSYLEALEEALCFGWIDSQKQAYDEDYFLQKFSPRGPKSVWSKINVAKAEELIKSGKMQPNGLQAINAAKQDGRWDAAYNSPSNNQVPADFLAELDKNPRAKQFFGTLNKTNVYAFSWRIHTAKTPETRKEKIDQFIEMLNRGQKLH